MFPPRWPTEGINSIVLTKPSRATASGQPARAGTADSSGHCFRTASTFSTAAGIAKSMTPTPSHMCRFSVSPTWSSSAQRIDHAVRSPPAASAPRSKPEITATIEVNAPSTNSHAAAISNPLDRLNKPKNSMANAPTIRPIGKCSTTTCILPMKVPQLPLESAPASEAKAGVAISSANDARMSRTNVRIRSCVLLLCVQSMGFS